MSQFLLLDGTSANFNFQTDVNAADLTAANQTGATIPPATSANYDSWKCAASYMSVDITQEFLIRTTFCSNRWVGRTPGLRDLNGLLDGFMSSGIKISDPLYLFQTTLGIPWIATINTGLTISANIMASRQHSGIRAFQNSEMGVAFAQDGTYISPSTVWITS
jgi:hypothetical protein